MDFAAAYIRVSTEEQTTYSPAAQLEEIKEFARKNEYCIPEESPGGKPKTAPLSSV